MTRVARRTALFLCCALTSCIVQPRDPFVTAERAMQRDDLLSALQAYDTVPVTHPRYPDARAAAVEIETRMRRCHELILEALVLRGEWRDEEALEALRRARKQWAQQPSIERWIVATEQRRKLFVTAQRPVAAVAEPVVEPATPSPETSTLAAQSIDVERAGNSVEAAPRRRERPVRPSVMPGDVVPTVAPSPDEHPAPASATAAASPVTVTQPVVVVGAAPVGESKPSPAERAPKVAVAPRLRPVERVSVAEDPVALGLISVEGRLGRGEFRQAVDDLVELARRFPTDLRVCQRLVPLLKQRALLSYGDGTVSAAVADWRRVLELQPDDPTVPGLIQRALGEAGRD